MNPSASPNSSPAAAVCPAPENNKQCDIVTYSERSTPVNYRVKAVLAVKRVKTMVESRGSPDCISKFVVLGTALEEMP
jgi:hypothetical protein